MFNLLDIEYKILGTLILSDNSTDRRQIIQTVKSDNFTDETARQIFIKICNTLKTFPNADLDILTAELLPDELRLFTATAETMLSPQIAHNQLNDTLRAFQQLQTQRQLREKMSELQIQPEVSAADIQQLADMANCQKIQRKNALTAFIQNYNSKHKRIETGFLQLDTMLNGGFQSGTVAAFGARPSTGKTCFACNIALHTAKKGFKTLFFSLEMTSSMIIERLLASCSNYTYSSIQQRYATIIDLQPYLDSFPETLDIIDDISEVNGICDIIYTEKPDICFVDFIQICTVSNKNFPDTRQKIDYISQRLKQTAKMTGCCIVILSQMTRASKEKPTMSDLKESGTLEQDSDYVLLLHRPFVYDKSGNNSENETAVILDKNKFGKTGQLNFRFDGCYQKFTELSKDLSQVETHKEQVVSFDNLTLPF